MYVIIKQGLGEEPSRIDALEFCQGGGLWQPIIVRTQQEKDYLMAMQLMVGKTYEVCLDGVDKPMSDTPPTFASLPQLL